MAHVIIHMKPAAAGHWFPTFRLARQLLARGHRVTYVGIPDDADLVGGRFPFHPIFEDVAPLGLTHRLNETAAVAPLRTQAGYYRILRGAIAAYLQGRMEQELEKLKADAVLADVGMQLTLLAAYRLRLPHLGFATDFTSPFRPGVPPVTSSQIPGDGWLARARITAQWARPLLQARLISWSGWYGWPRASVHAMARRCGFPEEHINRWSVHATLQLPHAVACPRSFDFPAGLPPGRLYGDPLVDLDRAEEPGATSEPWFSSDRPLIYCSLGSHSHLFAARGRVWRTLTEAFSRLPQYECVLQVGHGFDRSLLGSIPSNVHVLEWAPQIRILKRARVAMTHGGLGSVKECIALGVPMLVIPQVNDQPGNAARVAFHKLGRVLTVEQLTPEVLRKALEDLAENPAWRTALEPVRQDFLQQDEQQVIARLMEARMEQRP